MKSQPKHWQNHYPAGPDTSPLHFGLADRMRYYWPEPGVDAAVKELLGAVGNRQIADHIYAEYFSPWVMEHADGLAANRPLALCRAEVQAALAPYFWEAQA